jgi:hypothetical protein
LLAVGAGHRAMTPSAYASAESMAREVADQVFSDANRSVLLPCDPGNAASAPAGSGKVFDSACAARFIADAGHLLYRRVLTAAEVQDLLQLAAAEAHQFGDDFRAGVKMSLVAMLASPTFLFRIEMAEPDPHKTGAYRLTASSKASRLSFLLWDTTPDTLLLAAAERGDLDTARGLAQQVDRLMASPRLVTGVRTFFADMLGFDQFSTFSKDPQFFPNFTMQATADAPEQTLRTIVDQLVYSQGDYRDLLTTRKTFMTPALAALEHVPMAQARPNGAVQRWQAYEFPAGDPHIGLLAQPAFIALNTHPGRTSPTLRGKAVREKLLCQDVPPPPGDVQFNVVQDTGNPELKTVRQRLMAHAVEPACKGCHKVMDPIGLTLEMFDSAGAYRTTENGVTIDTSGDVDGVRVATMAELTAALHDNRALTACLVRRVYVYGSGKRLSRGDRALLKTLNRDFDKDGNFIKLLRAIAVDDEFYRVAQL